MAWHHGELIKESQSGKACLWIIGDKEVWLPKTACPSRHRQDGKEEVWVPTSLEREKGLTVAHKAPPITFKLPEAYATLEQIRKYLDEHIKTGRETPMDSIWLLGIVEEALDNRRSPDVN